MGSLVIWVIHICWPASGPGGERFQWNLPYYFHISHFLPLVFKILPFTYFYSPRLLESGGQRKGMANEVRGFKHTDTFWFLYFPCGHQDYHSHWGYLACFRSILLHVNICAHISLWCPCTSPYIYTLFFSFILVSGMDQLAYVATVYGYHGDHSERPAFCI